MQSNRERIIDGIAARTSEKIEVTFKTASVGIHSQGSREKIIVRREILLEQLRSGQIDENLRGGAVYTKQGEKAFLE
jgi:hypothetical protein